MNTPMNAKLANAVLLICCLISFGGHPANCEISEAVSGIDDYMGGIAFLLDGDIHLSDIEGGDIKRLTQTDGKVEDFRFSPDLKYLAYTKVSGMVEDVGLWEDGEEVPLTEIWSIVIVNLGTMTKVTEIEPDGEWLYFGKWSTPDKLLYYSSSGFDVSGFYHYDALTNSIRELDYLDGNRQLSADFSADGKQMVYIDDAGLGESFHYRLHFAIPGANTDKVLASRQRIRNQSFSHDSKSVAFVEIQSNADDTAAIVWIHGLDSDTTEKLITLPAKTRGASSLSWSAGDSCLGLFYSASYGRNGYIFPVADPSDLHEISGRQFCWAGDNAILYSRGASGIFLYDLKRKEETLLIKGATHPTYLKRTH